MTAVESGDPLNLDKYAYRGIEYGISKTKSGEWRWAYYSKIGRGAVTRGNVTGSLDDAITACEAAIDAWLALLRR